MCFYYRLMNTYLQIDEYLFEVRLLLREEAM
jgi:hypothetical protein